MDIQSIPDIFHSKIRLAIVSALINGEKTFNEIREITGATDGNISRHMTKLESVGFVVIKKEFIKRKTRTTYQLTDLGSNKFQDYVLLLESILKSKKS